MLKRGLLLLLAVSLSGLQVAQAQVTTATISGTVKDETDAVLPGVSVVIKNAETGIERNVVTDDEGRYKGTNLGLGNYEVTATLEGFQSSLRSGIELTIGREAIVNFALKIGEVSEQVTVSGEAPLIETTTGGLGDLVSERSASELPLNGRDLTDLLTLQAGTVSVSTGTTGSRAGYSQRVSVSGARPMDNSILIDGTETKSIDGGVPSGVSGSFVGSESVQEFKVERNSYSAQYGGAAGGVINVVSKGGTNAFHGSVYEFLRNDNLDAANFRDAPLLDSSRKFIGKAKPEFKRNQFGFSVGGPIIKNKTFFFGNYEGQRERLGTTDFLRTLTPAARAGQLQSPATLQFTTVVVNPAVIPYFKLWPLPGPGAEDLHDGTAREQVTVNQPSSDNYYQIRVDHHFSESDSLFGRITRTTSSRLRTKVIPNYKTEDLTYRTFLTVEETKIFSPQLLNTFRFAFNRNGLGQDSLEDPAVDPSLYYVPVSAWKSPKGSKPALGATSVTGLSPIGLGGTDDTWTDSRVDRLQYIDDIVYNSGGHSWKFGLNWQNIHFDVNDTSRPGGNYSFNSITNFLRGVPNSFRGDILPGSTPDRSLRSQLVGWYVQDDWTLSPRLTLNLGFRHEFFTVPSEVNGKIGNLRHPLTDTPATIAKGDPWFNNPSLKSFMPRVGIAWDPTGSGKTAIRLGSGIFYNHIPMETYRTSIIRSAPFALEINQNTNVPFPGIYALALTGAVGQPDIQIFAHDYMRNPHMVQWNLNIQREVLPQTSVTVGYAGSRGLNLIKRVSLNTPHAQVINGRYVFPEAPNPNDLASALPNQAFRQLTLDSAEASTDSWYHSLQIGAQRRYQAGFQAQMSYTFSKVIDEGSQIQPTFSNNGSPTPYVWDPDMRRGLAAFDVRHVFSSNFLWEAPFGPGKRFGSSMTGVTNALLGGWQIGGILSIAAGPHTSISVGTPADLNAWNLGGQTPDVKPGADPNTIIGSPDVWFDSSMFLLAPARTIGQLGRSTLSGPGVANFDLSLKKGFAFSESTSLTFGADIFNLFNRANLALPATNVIDASNRLVGGVGFISRTTTTARQIQLGLKLKF